MRNLWAQAGSRREKRISERADKDVKENVGQLEAIDRELGTSLGSTYAGTIADAYGPLLRCYVRGADRVRLVFSLALCSTALGLWGLSFYFAAADVFFPGDLPMRAALAGLSILVILPFALLVAVSIGLPVRRRQTKRVAEYLVFYRFVCALHRLLWDSALDWEGNRSVLLEELNSAAHSLSDLKGRADSAHEQIRFESARRFEAISRKVLTLEEEIIFPKAGALESLRRTLVEYLVWAIERHYGMMPEAPLPPIGEVARGRIQGFFVWARNVVVACVLAFPFALLAGWLTHWETDIETILSPATAGEWMGLMLYAAVVMSVAAIVNPGVVKNIGRAGELLATRK